MFKKHSFASLACRPENAPIVRACVILKKSCQTSREPQSHNTRARSARSAGDHVCMDARMAGVIGRLTLYSYHCSRRAAEQTPFEIRRPIILRSARRLLAVTYPRRAASHSFCVLTNPSPRPHDHLQREGGRWMRNGGTRARRPHVGRARCDHCQLGPLCIDPHCATISTVHYMRSTSGACGRRHRSLSRMGVWPDHSCLRVV
jgi:hypothetical protein